MNGQMSTAFGRSMKALDVLIVDDSASMRGLLRTLLGSFGIAEVRQARDGTSALAEMERRPPTLVISDWEMAPMNGRDFLRSVRRIGREPLCFAPIIVVTAHASKQLIQEAFDSGATQLLVKPITPANLLQRIGWVLEDDRPFVKMGDIYLQSMQLMHNRGEIAPAVATNTVPNWVID